MFQAIRQHTAGRAARTVVAAGLTTCALAPAAAQAARPRHAPARQPEDHELRPQDPREEPQRRDRRPATRAPGATRTRASYVQNDGECGARTHGFWDRYYPTTDGPEGVDTLDLRYGALADLNSCRLGSFYPDAQPALVHAIENVVGDVTAQRSSRSACPSTTGRSSS